MKIISRKLALTHLAIYEIAQCSKKDIDNIVYLTLTNRGNYDICPLCYWEDDGKAYDELDSYSSVNHATLGTYRTKFEGRKFELNKIPYRHSSNII